MFFGRQELLERIYSEVTSGPLGQCFVLYGQKRSGKSSVLRQLAKRLRPPNLAIYLSLGTIDTAKAERSFVQACIDSLYERLVHDFDMTDIMEQHWPREFQVESSPIESFRRSVRASTRLLEARKGWRDVRPIFLIDEFTYVYEYIREGLLTPAFMRQWKSLLESRTFDAVLVGQDTMPRFKEAYPNEFGVTHDERISYLSEEEARALAEDPIMMGSESRYKGASLDRLISLTAGSAFYLQIFCDRLVQHLNRNRLAFITESVVGDVLGQLTMGPAALPMDKFDPLITAAGESVALAPKERYLALLTRVALNPSITSQEVGAEDAAAGARPFRARGPRAGRQRTAAYPGGTVRRVAASQQRRECGMTTANPFVGYGTIASDERFVGRDLERGALRRRLYEARSSAALIGLTRMGKSSLANQILRETPDEKTLTGWINIATVRSGAEVLQDILALCPAETVLHRDLHDRGQRTGRGGAHDAHEVPIHDLYRMIREALLRLGRSGGHLVVVLDEFDSIKLFPDARDFLNLLRELVYYPDRIPMAALAVARRPIDRIEVDAADVSSFAGVCDSIYLRPMDYEQVRAMAARSGELSDDAPDVAWKYAAGHPFLSEVAFCRMLEHEMTDIGRIIQSDLSSYYKKLEDFMRKEELWEPLLKLASGRGIEVDVEQGALVRRYGLIDENGEVWSPDFSAYLRSR